MEVEGQVSANHSEILTAFPLAPAEPWLPHKASLHSPSKSGSRHDSGACGHDPSKCCFLVAALVSVKQLAAIRRTGTADPFYSGDC